MAGWPSTLDPEKVALPHLNPATAAGISAAIAGNILISLALNCQKLAHRRLEREREAARKDEMENEHQITRNTSSVTLGDVDEETETDAQDGVVVGPSASGVALVETQPLLRHNTEPSNYGSRSTPESLSNGHRKLPKVSFMNRLRPWRARTKGISSSMDRAHVGASHAIVPVDVVAVLPNNSHETIGKNSKTHNTDDDSNEGDYLKSKLWWSGFLLMNIGEMGNFISYGFAPASVVAPLGTFALIANCVFAPLMLKERFRKRDFIGIVIAIIGAVTVVLSTNPSDVHLDHEGLIKAISQRTFIVYAIIYIIGAIVLSGLSEREIGKRHVYVDVGLCALFGGFTVLSTKALSTLLTKEWFEVFTQWITYPVIAILLGTGVGQIRYLNRALMRFDSKIVVPTQFVLFNLSAIIGSAILYGDFKKAAFHQIVTFLYGCATTFAGVFIIAWAPSGRSDGSEDHHHVCSDVESGTAEDDIPHNFHIGNVGRRDRATLVIPDGVNAAQSTPGSPILNKRRSVISMVGLSPAQRLLLAHTLPHDDETDFFRSLSQDLERDIFDAQDPYYRRRAISWAGEDPAVHRTAVRRAASNLAAQHSQQGHHHGTEDGLN